MPPVFVSWFSDLMTGANTVRACITNNFQCADALRSTRSVSFVPALQYAFRSGARRRRTTKPAGRTRYPASYAKLAESYNTSYKIIAKRRSRYTILYSTSDTSFVVRSMEHVTSRSNGFKNQSVTRHPIRPSIIYSLCGCYYVSSDDEIKTNGSETAIKYYGLV